MAKTVVRSVIVVLVLVQFAACGGPDGAAPPPGSGGQVTVPPGQDREVMPAGVQLIGADIAHDTEPQVTPAELAALVDGQNQLGIDVYRNLAGRADAKENLMISPTSIGTDLAMVYAGAKGGTADEMRKALHFDLPVVRLPVAFNRLGLDLASRRRDKVDLRTANKLWAAKGLELHRPFVDTTSRSYDAPVAAADFAADPEAARNAINPWTAQRTNDRIKSLFPQGSIDQSTALVLVNAVYLNAEWKAPLNPTQDREFTKLDGTKVSVPMMRDDEYLSTAYGEGWQAVEIPYSGDELSMVVIVPSDLKAYEATLDRARRHDVFSKLHETGIHLVLPRFSFTFHAGLNDTLKTLGMASAFGPEADFSGMSDRPLSISTVEHEAFIKVDDRGTEAAAATGAAMASSHGPTITADKPFMFAIRDKKTNAVMFLGRVLDPSKES